MRKGRIKKIIVGLAIVAGTVSMSAGIASAMEQNPVSYKTSGELQKACEKNQGTFENDGSGEYSCTKNHADGSTDSYACLGPLQICTHYHWKPGKAPAPSPTAGTGIVVTPGGAQSTPTRNAGTGVLVTPGGAQPTPTAPSVAVSAGVSSAGALAR